MTNVSVPRSRRPSRKSQTAKVRIRKANKRDAKIVARVIRSSFSEYRRDDLGPKGAFLDAKKVRNHIRTKKKSYAVAHENGKGVGAIGYKVKKKQLTFGPVGVVPRFRRRGVGRHLLRWVEAHARKKKCRAVRAEVLRGLHSLVDFYRKNGYRTYRNRKGRTFAHKRLR